MLVFPRKLWKTRQKRLLSSCYQSVGPLQSRNIAGGLVNYLPPGGAALKSNPRVSAVTSYVTFYPLTAIYVYARNLDLAL
jgi:hypothetical protein